MVSTLIKLDQVTRNGIHETLNMSAPEKMTITRILNGEQAIVIRKNLTNITHDRCLLISQQLAWKGTASSHWRVQAPGPAVEAIASPPTLAWHAEMHVPNVTALDGTDENIHNAGLVQIMIPHVGTLCRVGLQGTHQHALLPESLREPPAS